MNFSILKVVITISLALMAGGCGTGLDVCWSPQATIREPPDVRTVHANIHVGVMNPSFVKNGLVVKGQAPRQILLKYRQGQGKWQTRVIPVTPNGKAYNDILPLNNVPEDLEYIIEVDGVVVSHKGKARGPYTVPIQPGEPDRPITGVYKEALAIGKEHVRGHISNLTVVNRIRRSKEVSGSNANEWKSGYIDGYVQGKLEVYPGLDKNVLYRDAENEYNALSRI